MMRWSRGEALLMCGHTYDYVLILDYKCTVDVKDVFWSAEGKERAVCSATRAFPWVDCIRGGKVTFDHWKLSDWQGLYSTFCLIHGLETRIARESLLSLSLLLTELIMTGQCLTQGKDIQHDVARSQRPGKFVNKHIYMHIHVYIFKWITIKFNTYLFWRLYQKNCHQKLNQHGNNCITAVSS